jgi:hypothetical protein
MRRRDFIKVVAGTVAWPLAARRQQPALPVIGFLSLATADDLQPRHLDDGMCGEMRSGENDERLHQRWTWSAQDSRPHIDRIGTDVEDNWNCLRRCFGCERRGRAGRDRDDRHLALNEFGRQRWQPFVPIVCPPVFD